MIYLMRHGQDDETRLGGWSDAGLTPLGIQQAKQAAETLAAGDFSIRSIYASDIRRAMQTAEIVAARLSLPITPAPQFREINNGLLAGMPKSEAQIRYPDLRFPTLGWDEHYPEGDSPHSFFERIKEAWAAFRQMPHTGNVLLVTHGGVMNAVYCIEHGETFTNRERAYRAGKAEIIGF